MRMKLIGTCERVWSNTYGFQPVGAGAGGEVEVSRPLAQPESLAIMSRWLNLRLIGERAKSEGVEGAEGEGDRLLSTPSLS